MIPYREYVNHMMREYFAREHDAKELRDMLQPDFARTKAERINYVVCAGAIREMRESEVEILREVYSGTERSEVAETVRKCAKEHGMSEKAVWGILRGATKEIARRRGLI